MSTKRTPIARAIRKNLTPQLVAQFMTAIEIIEAGDRETWEEAGGRRREYSDLRNAIDRALGRAPWQINPLNVDLDAEPSERDLEPLRDYAGARELRIALDQAAAEMQGA